MKLKLSILFLSIAAVFIYFVFKGNYFSFDSKSGAPVKQEQLTKNFIIEKLSAFDIKDYKGVAVSLDKSLLENSESIVIHFWASWCSPCISEVPELIEYSKKNSNVKFIIISVDESKEDIAKFVKSFPEFDSDRYIKIWDNPSQLSSFLDVDRLPMSIILKKNKNEPQFVRSVVDWKNLSL